MRIRIPNLLTKTHSTIEPCAWRIEQECSWINTGSRRQHMKWQSHLISQALWVTHHLEGGGFKVYPCRGGGCAEGGESMCPCMLGSNCIFMGAVIPRIKICPCTHACKFWKLDGFQKHWAYANNRGRKISSENLPGDDKSCVLGVDDDVWLTSFLTTQRPQCGTSPDNAVLLFVTSSGQRQNQRFMVVNTTHRICRRGDTKQNWFVETVYPPANHWTDNKSFTESFPVGPGHEELMYN